MLGTDHTQREQTGCIRGRTIPVDPLTPEVDSGGSREWYRSVSWPVERQRPTRCTTRVAVEDQVATAPYQRCGQVSRYSEDNTRQVTRGSGTNVDLDCAELMLQVAAPRLRCSERAVRPTLVSPDASSQTFFISS